MTTEEVECALCHRLVRSAAARKRRVGSGCWRKLSPAQRQAIRQSPAAARAALSRPVPAADGQLPFDEQDTDR